MRYPEIISLGQNCEVKENLIAWWEELSERDQAFDRDCLQHRGNHLFDWNITDHWRLVEILTRNLDGIFERHNLHALEKTDGVHNYVRDDGTGILFHHTFTRINGFASQETVDLEYDEKLPKIRYLVEKFRAILKSESHIYFVRRGDADTISVQRMIETFDAIRAGRPYSLIIVSYSPCDHKSSDISPNLTEFSIPLEEAWKLEHWRPIFNFILADAAKKSGDKKYYNTYFHKDGTFRERAGVATWYQMVRDLMWGKRRPREKLVPL